LELRIHTQCVVLPTSSVWYIWNLKQPYSAETSNSLLLSLLQLHLLLTL
jgi:hypothetical protein